MIDELGITKNELVNLCKTLTYEQIGNKLNIKKQKIGWWARKFGIKPFRSTRKDIKYNCELCGNEHSTKAAIYHKLKHHFCSQKCCGEWRILYGPKGKDNPKWNRKNYICEYCKIEFCPVSRQKTSKHYFCSHPCFYEWRKLQPRKPKKKRVDKKILTNCKQCNKELLRRPEEIKNAKYGVFCPDGCLGLWKSLNLTGDKIYNFKGGYNKWENYGPSWAGAKRLARKRDNNTCQCCFKTKKNTGKNMDVHHFVGFRHFGLEKHLEGNDLNNLVCLCNRCHTKFDVETNKSIDKLSNQSLESIKSLVTDDFKKYMFNKLKIV